MRVTESAQRLRHCVDCVVDELLHRGLLFEQRCDAFGELAQERFQRPLLAGIAKVGNLEGNRLATGRPAVLRHRFGLGMGALVRLEKRAPFLGREVTDLEDGLDVPRGERHRIDGVGELRDEALVLSQRQRDAGPHPGRAAIDRIAQDRLVGRDRPRIGGLRSRRGPSGHGPTPRA